MLFFLAYNFKTNITLYYNNYIQATISLTDCIAINRFVFIIENNKLFRVFRTI